MFIIYHSAVHFFMFTQLVSCLWMGIYKHNQRKQQLDTHLFLVKFRFVNNDIAIFYNLNF